MRRKTYCNRISDAPLGNIGKNNSKKAYLVLTEGRRKLWTKAFWTRLHKTVPQIIPQVDTRSITSELVAAEQADVPYLCCATSSRVDDSAGVGQLSHAIKYKVGGKRAPPCAYRMVFRCSMQVKMLPRTSAGGEFHRLLASADVILHPFPFGGSKTSADGLALGKRAGRRYLTYMIGDLRLFLDT